MYEYEEENGSEEDQFYSIFLAEVAGLMDSLCDSKYFRIFDWLVVTIINTSPSRLSQSAHDGWVQYHQCSPVVIPLQDLVSTIVTKKNI